MAFERETQALVIDLMASDPIVIAAELPVAKVAQVLADYEASLGEAAHLMTENRVDRLVVVGDDAERALGVISAGDVLRAFAR